MARRRLDRDQLGIFCWFFCEVTVLSLVGVALWLSLTPRNPRFKISTARFPPLNSTTNASSIVLAVDLQIFNPNNHMGIDYSGISLKLCAGDGDGDGVVGENAASAFYQGYKNTTLFKMQIQTKNANPYIGFTVRVETAFRFRIIKWQTKLHHVAHEERFSKPDVNLNGTVPAGTYVQLPNALKSYNRKLRCLIRSSIGI